MRPPTSRTMAVLRTRDPEPVELAWGLICASWGLWLVLPFTTWTGAAYAVMRSVWQWETLQGGSFMAVGIYRIVLAVRGGHILARLLLALLAALLWAITLVSIAAWHWQSTGTPVYAAFVLVNLWAAWRLASELRSDSDGRR